jgi:hypothetical protein
LSLANDAAGQHQIVQNGLMDSSQGAAMRALLRLAELNDSTWYLDPARLNGAGHYEQYSSSELFLKLNVQLLSIVVQGLKKVVRNEHNDHRLLALVFRHVQFNSLGQLQSFDFRDGALHLGDCRSDGGLKSCQILH